MLRPPERADPPATVLPAPAPTFFAPTDRGYLDSRKDPPYAPALSERPFGIHRPLDYVPPEAVEPEASGRASGGGTGAGRIGVWGGEVRRRRPQGGLRHAGGGSGFYGQARRARDQRPRAGAGHGHDAEG